MSDQNIHIDGFKRYVGFAIVARNIQRLNTLLMVEKSSKHRKGVSKVRTKWLISVIEHDQKSNIGAPALKNCRDYGQ